MISVMQSTRVPPLPFSGALLALAVGLAWLISPPCKAQPPSDSPPGPASGAPDGDELSPAAEKVEVNPQSRDEDIGQRLQRVLDATEWFDQPAVRVEEGVVFLTGKTQTAELKKWAGDL